MRSTRRWLAALMIVGFACAQSISLARACGLGADLAHSNPATQAAAAAGMPADCPFMGDAGTIHVTCEAQCMPRAQADKGADARIALAPPAVLVVRVVPPAALSSTRSVRPLVRIASPPLALLFGRFLI